ncbi:MAG: hypothetical protein BWY93_01702 [Euryarchaeota archaeon ADurb.BinA087]|nr:hypothetical protein [Methanoregulaceae archaeon]OPZ42698.1 MAG: hypothetical protein BWY93_01702 [Euryarchaeota archaeon ADurb.BinA087]HPX73142.1 DUF2148 domain-containing protein [Methanoregulaceae archaeon]HQA80395.1 DUF2148 domain-containing protein [Methanoregulaceae archaeon]
MKDTDEAVRLAISLMAVSARTAPKGKGKDSIVNRTVLNADRSLLSLEMIRYGNEHSQPFFVRDGKNIAASDACLLIGARGYEPLGLNCHGCGFGSCAEMEASRDRAPVKGPPFAGPNCIIKMTDLGIAVGSAAKTASLLNLDNRIMYTAGVAGLSLGWMESCSVAYGIPVSVTGKSIFFDRPVG